MLKAKSHHSLVSSSEIPFPSKISIVVFESCVGIPLGLCGLPDLPLGLLLQVLVARLLGLSDASLLRVGVGVLLAFELASLLKYDVASGGVAWVASVSISTGSCVSVRSSQESGTAGPSITSSSDEENSCCLEVWLQVWCLCLVLAIINF
ncbi:hypothetical protein DSO57_1016635 [Entomophthora muscae]|uniref:Uncharacterized protein n=1 Tax=Entomophthora muscae TaxID=34485 RepID=A0ACC2U3W4_9FUNG|nr:hypothetical protein DSO57_1016635 [Entomophthora muscae]